METMTDETDTEKLRQRVEQLEKRVDDLEGQVDDTTDSVAGDDGLDRYDRAVLEDVDNVDDVHPRVLMRAYDRAGVVNKKTKKRRAKRLRRVAGGGENR